MPSERIASTGGVDTHQLKEFVRDLRRTYPVAAKGLRENLRAAGEIVAVEARKKAGEHSKSIPPTIRTSVYGSSVSVKAGNKSNALAALYEVGNKGDGGKSDTFRHPLFGNWTYPQDQLRYPFLAPAVDAAGPAMEVELEKVADEIVDILTLRGR